jgi:hypothetical protein
MPFGTMVNSQYYCALLQDKVWPALGHKQAELLKHGAIVCQDNKTPHCHCDVQNLVQHWGSEMLAQPLYSPDLTLCDYWLLHA